MYVSFFPALLAVRFVSVTLAVLRSVEMTHFIGGNRKGMKMEWKKAVKLFPAVRRGA